MIEYSGYAEVVRNRDGKTIRMPFVFYSRDILTYQERQDRVREIYDQFWSIVVSSDPSRQNAYSEPGMIRFTSVNDIPSPADDPYSGVPLPEPYIGR